MCIVFSTVKDDILEGDETMTFEATAMDGDDFFYDERNVIYLTVYEVEGKSVLMLRAEV